MWAYQQVNAREPNASAYELMGNVDANRDRSNRLIRTPKGSNTCPDNSVLTLQLPG